MVEEIKELHELTLADLVELTRLRGPNELLEFRLDIGTEDEAYVVISVGDAAVLVAQALDEAFDEGEDHD